jgi:DNA-directed RNA polymerase subunit RPC12/RpoP
MSPTIELPPPDPESCLIASRVSRHKGGTLIDESICDLVDHVRRVCDPDGYRPASCPRCGHRRLHVHCYRERHPRGEAGLPPVIRIVQYICTRSDCGATWRILPRFLARHLWRAWTTVERVAGLDERAGAAAAAPAIPLRTRRRWRARLAATARVLVVLFAVSGGAVLEGLAMRLGVDATRRELVIAHAEVAGLPPGERLSTLAALVHRLERGIRLM